MKTLTLASEFGAIPVCLIILIVLLIIFLQIDAICTWAKKLTKKIKRKRRKK